MRLIAIATALTIVGGTTCPATVWGQGLTAPQLEGVTAEGHTVTLQFAVYAMPPYRVRVDAGLAPGVTNVSVLPVASLYGWVIRGAPNGTYYVRLRVEKDGLVSPPSNERVVTVTGCAGLPDPPTLQAEATGQTVDLRWTLTAPPGCFPNSLRLEAGRAPGATDLLSLDMGDYNYTSRQFRSVPFGTYYVRLRAERYGVLGPPSNEVRLDVGCVPPPAILNPRATTVGNAVRFSWDYGALVNVDLGVTLEAGSRPGSADIGARPIPPEAFEGFNVGGAAGMYYARLRATNACGSTVSAEMPVTLTSECVVPQPISFADAGLGNAVASVSWQPPSDGGLVTSYDVQVGSAPGQDDIARRSVDGRYTPPFGYFNESFSAPTTRAYLRITPRNACGVGPATDVHAIYDAVCPNPPAPRSMSARVTGSAVELWWSATVEGGFAYRTFAEIGRTPGASDVLTSPVATSYPPPGFTTALPAGRYYARARYTYFGCDVTSNPSPEVTFVIP